MKKICFILDTRITFMKAIPIYEALKNNFQLLLIHVRNNFDENINDGLIDIYRLRSRKNPGNPLWSMRAYKNKELESPRHLLGCVHWIDVPNIKFPEYIKKNKNIYVAPCKYANWSNNPFLCKTKWFLDNITIHFEKSLGINNEIDIQPWWENQNFNVGQGEGLFKHTDLRR